MINVILSPCMWTACEPNPWCECATLWFPCLPLWWCSLRGMRWGRSQYSASNI